MITIKETKIVNNPEWGLYNEPVYYLFGEHAVKVYLSGADIEDVSFVPNCFVRQTVKGRMEMTIEFAKRDGYIYHEISEDEYHTLIKKGVNNV